MTQKRRVKLTESEQSSLRNSFVTMSVGEKDEVEGVMIRIRSRRRGRREYVFLVLQEIPIACLGCEGIVCI